MDRINGANTVDIGGGRRGFRSQSKSAGIAGTELTQDWFNAVQEEILTVIESAGITPESGVWTQLRDAIALMIAGTLPGAVDLSGLLPRSGGTLTSGGHISDPGDPTDDDHLVRLGYLNGVLASALYSFIAINEANGAVRFPNGFTMVWGRYVGTVAYQHSVTVPWPMAFVAPPFVAIGNAGYIGAPTGLGSVSIEAQTKGNTTCQWYIRNHKEAAGTFSTGFDYIAIGW